MIPSIYCSGKHVIPKGYKLILELKETQQAIKTLKDCFQQQLSTALDLTRVSAPLFVTRESGLNDDLNGVERKVSFDSLEQPLEEVQVVQSLAKWKRMALKRYDMEPGKGLYTDMNAIRRDETTDNAHSIYVDQWDWEKVITKEQRTIEFLKDTVRRIHSAVLDAETTLYYRYPQLGLCLPADVKFITSQELLDLYPELTPPEREIEFVRKHKAAFIIQIGWPLSNGIRHDGRAPDYDDWSLNGDLMYYYKELDTALEMSSMGIRVDPDSLTVQLEHANCNQRREYPFHRALLNGELPLTMGGGIGQSRLCMFLLHKMHIGEVQCSVWPKDAVKWYLDQGITLL